MSAAETQEGTAGALPARSRASGKMWELDVIGRTWRFFTSVRLALVLILLIAAAVLVSRPIDQAPHLSIADPSAYPRGSIAPKANTALWTQVFDFRSFFNVFYPSGSASWSPS
jgi:hypothetical protein